MLSFLLASAITASVADAPLKNSVLDLTCQNLDGARIVSQESAPVYLGFFGNEFATNSVNNRFGTFGSEFNQLSVRNTFGRYGSSTSPESATNSFALRPPLIVRDGFVVAILSTNTVARAQGYAGVPRITLAEVDATCRFTSTTPRLFFSNQTGAGGLDTSFSGFWWNTSRSGEGLLLEFAEIEGRPFVFAILFSYDPSTRTPVFISGGAFYDRTSSAPVQFDVVLSTGGRFGANFNPAEVQRPSWGSFNVAVNSCNSVTLTYTSTLPAYGAGSLSFQRFLDRDAFTTCP